MSDPLADVTTAELAGRLGQPDLVLLDVRHELEFAGVLGSPCDPRQGHIPGARHIAIDELLDLDAAAVVEAVGVPPGTEVIAYCHSGARSEHAVGVLRSVGYAARNYRGSWHEWSQDPSLPVA